MYSIGVDIGGSHITTCVYDHYAKDIRKESLMSRKINSRGSKEEILDAWIDAIDRCRETANVEVVGVGLAMPGPFDYYNGISLIKNVDKLSALYGVNVRQELAEKLNFAPSAIRFINDATAFSVAESMIGCARNYQRVVAITLGTGLGASFVHTGRPVVTGADVPEGGFLYNQRYKSTTADELFSTRGILNLYKKLSGCNIENVRILCEQVASDDCARITMSRFGDDLGEFLAPFLKKFNADVLVLGGNIAKAYPYFGESLSHHLGFVDIKRTVLGERSAVIGGALLLDDHYFSTMESILKLM